LDSRERTFLSLDHQEPDRVPIDCWCSKGIKRKIAKDLHLTYEQFLDKYDVDLRYMEGPAYLQKSEPHTSDSNNFDIWGVPRHEVRIQFGESANRNFESYKEVAYSPLEGLESVEEIAGYKHWPSADWFDYSQIEKQCDEILQQKRVVVFMGDRLNRIAQLKPAMYIRGYEQILIDMLMNPEIAEAVLHNIFSFYLEYGRRILEAGKGKIDIFCTGDDFGTQNGSLISPDLWRTFLKKGFKEFIELGQSYGAKVMHHTCGSVYSLIPEMIDCRLDILQSIQPEAASMAPEVLKKEFGSRLSFQGGVSIQKVLPHGTPDDVDEHVRRIFTAMKPDGGYIACTSHNIQADTPARNIEALFAAYHAYGRY